MKIGLIDVDGHNFPNLALMKLSSYHKASGNLVEFANGFEHYDIVYQSKIFTFTNDFDFILNANIIIKGGTGYGLDNFLEKEIEHTCPDYSLYPQYSEAYGFTTRGCPRHCPFCIVTPKEGNRSIYVADLNEFWRGQKVICSMDSNLLACKDREKILQQYIDSNALVDFQSGLDIRFMTGDIAKMVAKIKMDMIHFAWDNPDEDLTTNFLQFNKQTTLNERNKVVYVLINYNSTEEQDLYRIYKLREMGYSPYVMIYDKANSQKRKRQMARWCNNRFIFRSCDDFNNYKP